MNASNSEKRLAVGLMVAALAIAPLVDGGGYAGDGAHGSGLVASAQAQTLPLRPEAKGSPPARTAARGVTVNGQRLGEQEIAALTRFYQVQVRDGDYWYDRMNGSWGRRGGPTDGFILAGLNLGGPLREDASNGDTGVYINGRQLHRIDVARLRLIGPVYPGRCWMDAYGNIGLEGQPAFANIWLAAQALGGGRKEGILSTYDKTGVAVFGY